MEKIIESATRLIHQENLLAGNRGNLCGVVANVEECDIVVSEFELQANYYVHFWTNILWKGMNLLIITGMS